MVNCTRSGEVGEKFNLLEIFHFEGKKMREIREPLCVSPFNLLGGSEHG